MGDEVTESGLPMHGELRVRCRRCARCLAYRRAHWTGRILEELQGATRTWFGTLTLAPHEHILAELRAGVTARGRSVDFDGCAPEERFARYVGAIYPEIQLWLKRLRKRQQARFRYVIVAEKHTEQLSGYAHFHLLLFEQEGAGLLRKRVLESEWKLGHSHWRLVDRESGPDRMIAGYLAKYLSKELATRVWASGRGRSVATAVDSSPPEPARSLEETFFAPHPTGLTPVTREQGETRVEEPPSSLTSSP